MAIDNRGVSPSQKNMTHSKMPLLLLIVVLSSSLLTQNLSQHVFAQMNQPSSNIWYVGKGTEEKMYMVYQIQSNETDGGKPFLISLYFKHLNNDTGEWDAYWIVPVSVKNYSGHVINGTFNILDREFYVLPSSNVSSALAPYKNTTNNTILFLTAYSAKEAPLPLDANRWSGIDRPFVGPNGTENIVTPAATFNQATVIAIKDPNYNKIWVDKATPLPVKGTIPAAGFSFELMDIGKSDKPQPLTIPEFGSPFVTATMAIGAMVGIIAVLGRYKSFVGTG